MPDENQTKSVKKKPHVQVDIACPACNAPIEVSVTRIRLNPVEKAVYEEEVTAQLKMFNEGNTEDVDTEATLFDKPREGKSPPKAKKTAKKKTAKKTARKGRSK